MSTWAVLAAAGRGERLGADLPKAFIPFGEHVLLAESMARLDACEWVDGVVVATPEGWDEPAILLAEELGCDKVSVAIVGGESRAESVRLAVAEIPDDAAVILVHDAARPLLQSDVVDRLLKALFQGFDGAVPGLPLTDTVKRWRDGVVLETLPRAELVAVQTPQAFLADVLRRALSGDIADSTDCASLVERAGGRVTVVPGDVRLAKVTGPEDVARVLAMLQAGA